MSALLLEQKYKEFTVYSYSALKQFPKSEKHGLAAELREAIWRGYRLIIAAMKRYHKKTTLTDLELHKSYAASEAGISEVKQAVDSWLAHARHASTTGLINHILSKPFVRS